MSRLHHTHWKPEAVGLETAPDLFDPLASVPDIQNYPLPPSVAVDTSLAAASRIAGHTSRIREAIYLYLRACGGATAGELCEKLGLNPSTCRPRLLELQGKAKWAPGLPARIQRSPDKRDGMRVYKTSEGGP